MKAEASIEHEPHRIFRYSLDGGRTWLTCVSTLRGDTTAVVKRDLEIRYRFPVIVRPPGTAPLVGQLSGMTGRRAYGYARYMGLAGATQSGGET